VLPQHDSVLKSDVIEMLPPLDDTSSFFLERPVLVLLGRNAGDGRTATPTHSDIS